MSAAAATGRPRGQSPAPRRADRAAATYPPDRRNLPDSLAPDEPTPVERRKKRDDNMHRKKVLAATKVQAAYRGKAARAQARGKGMHATTVGEISSRLEPQLTSALAILVALQWDQAVIYQIGDNVELPGYIAANAAAVMLHACILTLVMLAVREGYNQRALSLIKLALQVLVGWMWRLLVEVTDAHIGAVYLTHLSLPNIMWARFGIVTGFALVFAPLLTLLITAMLHPGRVNPGDNFGKAFGTLLLGAGSLVTGFAWHLALVNFSLAMVEHGLGAEGSRENYYDYAFAAAFCRAIFVTAMAGILKAWTPLRHASRIAKPPKKDDTFGKSFRERSIFAGANALLWMLAFAWFAVIESLAELVREEQNFWGAYIVYTTMAAVFFICAVLLAWRGSAAPKCCRAIAPLGAIELMFFGIVQIELGFSLFASYAALVFRLATFTETGVIFWAVACFLMVMMWTIILWSACMSREIARQVPPAAVPAKPAGEGAQKPAPAPARQPSGYGSTSSRDVNGSASRPAAATSSRSQPAQSTPGYQKPYGGG